MSEAHRFDEQVHKYLVDTAPDEREKQRLLRVAQPHAGAFVTAVPSEEDGKGTILRPRIYRIAIASRLGVPVLQNEIICLCKQPINKYGDHAAQSPVGFVNRSVPAVDGRHPAWKVGIGENHHAAASHRGL